MKDEVRLIWEQRSFTCRSVSAFHSCPCFAAGGDVEIYMDDRANSILSESNCVKFITPASTRAIKRGFSLIMFFGAFLISAACASTVFMLAMQCGAPAIVAWVPGAVTYVLFFRKGCQIAAEPTRFRIILGPDSVSIGDGWLRRSYPYDEVEAISLPESKYEGNGIGLEGGARGAFVYLSPADESRCAALLRIKCKNAIFVDHSGREHMPPCPDQPLLSIGALYRRNRSLAVGTIIPIVFAASLCAVTSIGLLCTLLGFANPGTFDLLMIVAKFCATLVALVCLIRFGSRRLKTARIIRKKMVEFQQKNAEA